MKETPEPQSAATAITAAVVWRSSGSSFFSEECKGGFALAAHQMDTLVAAAQTPEEVVDATVMRAFIHLLQGEPAPASLLLERALERVPNDANRSLWALSYMLLAMHQRYNAFPDGRGAGAEDVSARWRGAEDLLPWDTRWHNTMRSSTFPNTQVEAEIIYGFLAQLQPARYSIEIDRFKPPAQPRDQALAEATAPARKIIRMATAGKVPALAAFADWAAADLHHRGGDHSTARTL